MWLNSDPEERRETRDKRDAYKYFSIYLYPLCKPTNHLSPQTHACLPISPIYHEATSEPGTKELPMKENEG
jgi:hypothetical protein